LKKLLSLLLVVVMMLSVACEQSANPNTDDSENTEAQTKQTEESEKTDKIEKTEKTKRDNNDNDNDNDNDKNKEPDLDIPTDVKETKLYNSIQLIQGETYAMNMTFMGFNFIAYRDGENFYTNMGGVDGILIFDGKRFSRNDIDHENKIAYYTTLTEEEFEMEVQGGSDFTTMIPLEGIKIKKSGRKNFILQSGDDYGEMYYEEFTDYAKNKSIAYFDDNGDLFGFALETQGVGTNNMLAFEFSIKGKLPKDAFDMIPEGYKQAKLRRAR